MRVSRNEKVNTHRQTVRMCDARDEGQNAQPELMVQMLEKAVCFAVLYLPVYLQ